VPHHKRKVPTFLGLKPSSLHASRLAQLASLKSGTRCEVLLRKRVWALGIRYRLNSDHIPGKPDLVFPSARLAIFCDGDFWHGYKLEKRLAQLRKGHNAPYWTAKVLTNYKRDRRVDRQLRKAGWRVMRFWESHVRRSADAIALQIANAVRAQLMQ